MGIETKIQWCDHTFNCWIGCTKVSPGCDHCYAEAMMDKRLGRVKWGGVPIRTTESYWRQPLKWNADSEKRGVRERVFCASLADVFDNNAPNEWRHDLFKLIKSTPNLDWLLLTKRIGNARAMIEEAMIGDARYLNMIGELRNVWLGATVVNQEEADRDIPKLLATPAAVRFLSIEPMLGPIDLQYAAFNGADSLQSIEGIDWVICGGESGGDARPMEYEWAFELCHQCADAGVPFFMKQLGGVKDKRGDIDDFPDILRVREFPKCEAIK